MTLQRLVAWAAADDSAEREGRSYIVNAPTADLARTVARMAARDARQSNWLTASVLHIARVDGERYEVVLSC
jgi:hypothetical protein